MHEYIDHEALREAREIFNAQNSELGAQVILGKMDLNTHAHIFLKIIHDYNLKVGAILNGEVPLKLPI